VIGARELQVRTLVGLDHAGATSTGDILVFRMRNVGVAKHAGILAAPDQLVHAARGLGVVEIVPIRWWRTEGALFIDGSFAPA
jgi:cell wall-associated NlpC family hydrolase